MGKCPEGELQISFSSLHFMKIFYLKQFGSCTYFCTVRTTGTKIVVNHLWKVYIYTYIHVQVVSDKWYLMYCQQFDWHDYNYKMVSVVNALDFPPTSALTVFWKCDQVIRFWWQRCTVVKANFTQAGSLGSIPSCSAGREKNGSCPCYQVG